MRILVALPGLGKSYFVGLDRENNVKLDVYYSMEKFIRTPLISEGVRMATIEEIIAMKVDVVSRSGRKKDFWDLHELLPLYTVRTMLDLHVQRSEYTHDEGQIIQNFTDFTNADDDFDPICLRGKHWEFIKEDIETAVSKL